ncbi:DNA-binding protein [Pseudomonas mandelii]|uniref:helix-turn-helix domain-containing protein n=1 Tax=Pseudomonas mandelii TaxID=75612 RepID=UPI000BDAE94A|nr:DNA-binding protein [Pseudomonas mandelii]
MSCKLHAISQLRNSHENLRAWREHLNLTQDEVAKRMGISQPAFARQETVAKPRKATRGVDRAGVKANASRFEL